MEEDEIAKSNEPVLERLISNLETEIGIAAVNRINLKNRLHALTANRELNNDKIKEAVKSREESNVKPPYVERLSNLLERMRTENMAMESLHKGFCEVV